MIKFLIEGPLEHVIADKDITKIAVQTESASEPEGGVATDGLARQWRHIFESQFQVFFASHCDWIRTNISTNYHEWPEVWNFARVVRNAITHGGTININSENAPTVEWRGVVYNHTKFGTPIETELAVGDLFFLMLDMDQELDDLGAPLTPFTR